MAQVLELSLYLTCSYIPPNSDPQIYQQHAMIIKTVANKLKPADHLIVLGDFNIPSASWISADDTEFLIPITSNDWTHDFLMGLADINVFQINNVHNINMRVLDLIFVNNPALFDVIRTDPLCIPEDSHHPTLIISTPFPKKKSVQNTSETLCFTRTNFSYLNHLLSSINWFETLSFRNNGNDFEMVIHKFYAVINSFVSASTPTIKRVIVNRPPWFTNTLSWLKNRRNRLHKRYIKTKSAMDRSLYIIASSHFYSENKKRYDCYVSKIKHNLSKNPKMFFNFVNSKRRVSSYPTTMKFNDTTYSSDADIANIFAEFFASTFSSHTFDNASYSYESSSTTSIYISSLEVSTVLNHLKSLKSSCKPGSDGIPSIILKKCAEVLAEPLTYLFNISLKFGIFPICWKESFIIPLYKSGSRSNATNYRAIAKLNAIPKLFEKIITDILKHEISAVISPKQHGFCRGRSTTTNLMELTSYINSSFYNSQQTDVIYTDFSKAFDKVNHELLFVKLSAIGFTDNFLKWIKSYIMNRRQRVIFNNSKSNYIDVISGVPQGSHLGPLLFLIFINDLPNAIKYCNILMYADDVKIFSRIANNQDSTFLQADLNNFCNWCDLNLMELNLNKCKLMTFTRYSPFVTKYYINGTELSAVESMLDLGIYFDKKLNFNTHVIFAANKAKGVLCFIKRWAKEFRDPYVTKNLFTTLVRPILEYGSVIWDPQYNVYIKKIESVQKQFLLFCLSHFQWNPAVNLPPYRSRLALISLPTLKSRRIVANIVFFLNLFQGKLESITLRNEININIPSRHFRSYEPLRLQFQRSNFMIFDPFRRVCSDVNKFYDYIDFSDNVNISSRRLISYLNSNHYLYNCL